MFLTVKRGAFTLVELLISLAISTAIVLGLMGLIAGSVRHSNAALQVARLDRALHTAMDVMVSDITRAGYWAGSDTSNTNPFMISGSTDIQISGSCILLTYDKNQNSSLPSITSSSDDERYGFRLNGGAIQYRPWGATFSCTAAASAWENLTDPNVITITAFTPTLTTTSVDIDGTGSGTATNNIRKVTLTITGTLVRDTSVTRTVTQEIRVSNDKYAP